MVAGADVLLAAQSCTNERAELFAVEGITSFRFMQEAPESQNGKARSLQGGSALEDGRIWDLEKG
ncbi:hypothetical protein N7539_003714 [Penicillium diatomitis]|uniref:Uncharacterized protein n=1 Tax=Penicillium diatomitis TaxID=2819901 RepID=A0A9W9XCL3_9EURO|nr:uncharacterized protein N7539_003714 [Penicillium diatomitis]KAJ5488824.1 hypothetical protein N7539_003714 [Penicillium diatomitis]